METFWNLFFEKILFPLLITSLTVGSVTVFNFTQKKKHHKMSSEEYHQKLWAEFRKEQSLRESVEFTVIEKQIEAGKGMLVQVFRIMKRYMEELFTRMGYLGECESIDSHSEFRAYVGDTYYVQEYVLDKIEIEARRNHWAMLTDHELNKRAERLFGGMYDCFFRTWNPKTKGMKKALAENAHEIEHDIRKLFIEFYQSSRDLSVEGSKHIEAQYRRDYER